MATQKQDLMEVLICTILELYGNSHGASKGKVKISAPECKLAINHLIRSYGFFYLHKSPLFVSVKARGITDKKLLTIDHVVPVKEIMKALMDRSTTKAGVTPADLRDLLSTHLLTCRISKEEDVELTKNGLAQKMPDDAFDQHGNIVKYWARYDVSQGGVDIPYVSLAPENKANTIIDEIYQLP
jgi:hypothetical protein